VLDVVNTWTVPVFGHTPYGHLVIHSDRYEKESTDILRDACESVDTTGLQVNPISSRRVTVKGILEAAAGASLLVVGSRGRGAFERTVFGSVATQVSHHAPCPLVVVPPEPAGR
jgi:nucleotide-binding universal stress UspA family protein